MVLFPFCCCGVRVMTFGLFFHAYKVSMSGPEMVKVSRLTNTALLLWHFMPPSPSPPAEAWLKNYCIWCNLMDCWTVNMLQLQTAVLPRVKCDGWEREQGGHMEMNGHEGRKKFCFPLFHHSDHTLTVVFRPTPSPPRFCHCHLFYSLLIRVTGVQFSTPWD